MPEVKETIKKDESKITLRFAADGRRTSKRIGAVMAVFNILVKHKQTFEYQNTLAFYNGKCNEPTSFIILIIIKIIIKVTMIVITIIIIILNNNIPSFTSLLHPFID